MAHNGDGRTDAPYADAIATCLAKDMKGVMPMAKATMRLAFVSAMTALFVIAIAPVYAAD